MKITDVKADYVQCPLGGEFRPTWGAGLATSTVGMTVVRIETDEGITGVAAGTANGFENVVGVHTFIRPQLLGQDPLMIERLRPIITNAKLRMGWPWMVEAALWDLAGKACGLPVYKMWGGYQTKLPLYASSGELRPFEERRAYIQNCLDAGFRAIKLRMHADDVDAELDEIEQLASEFGGRVKFMVDANQADHLPGSTDIHTAWGTHTALHVARRLEKLNFLWLEEPLARFNYEGLATIARRCDIPLAGGEKNIGLNEFKDLAANEGYQILQGDCIFSEGMFQLRKAAALAEAYHKQFIPHTWSNPCGLMTNLQLAASLPNCPWFELPYEPPAYTFNTYRFAFQNPPKIEDGFIYLPEEPGLGFTLQEDFIEQYRVPFTREAIGLSEQ